MKTNKKILCYIFSIFIIFLVACTKPSKNNNNVSNDSESTQTSQTTSVSDKNFLDNNDISYMDNEEEFIFSSSLNVFLPNNLNEPLLNKISIENDKEIKLSLLTNVEPDQSMPMTDIPMRVWVIEDDVPIEFEVFDSGNYSLSNDILVDAKTDQMIDVSFLAQSDAKMITIVCVYFPEIIPEKGISSFGGAITYSLFNTEYNTNLEPIDFNSDNYVSVTKKDENYGIDIGKIKVEKNNFAVTEDHYSDDVVLSENDNLYVKFNDGNDNQNTSYYLMVLCDGNIIDLFDHCCIYKVNCKGGKQTFQYKIPDSLIPESGLHTFQAIAFPLNDSEELTPYTTYKIRVQV